MAEMKLRIYPTEDEEQTTVFSWAELASSRWPELRLMHHIPNGGRRSKAEAARFKAMGVRAGVPDIFLPVARGRYHGLYIELKAMDGKLTKQQKEFLEYVRGEGYAGVVAYGAEAAMDTIARYLKGVLDG